MKYLKYPFSFRCIASPSHFPPTLLLTELPSAAGGAGTLHMKTIRSANSWISWWSKMLQHTASKQSSAFTTSCRVSFTPVVGNFRRRYTHNVQLPLNLSLSPLSSVPDMFPNHPSWREQEPGKFLSSHLFDIDVQTSITEWQRPCWSERVLAVRLAAAFIEISPSHAFKWNENTCLLNTKCQSPLRPSNPSP